MIDKTTPRLRGNADGADLQGDTWSIAASVDPAEGEFPDPTDAYSDEEIDALFPDDPPRRARRVLASRPLDRAGEYDAADEPGSAIDPFPAPPADQAFFGIAGEIVRTMAPHTEALPIGMLLALLTAAGSALNRGPHLLIDGSRHAANLFMLLVGTTARGRKGTTWSRVMQVMRQVDDAWVARRIARGLSSGEGLIHHVRDPDPDSAEGQGEGETDKRLLVVEEEFGSVFRVIRREGNTLSPILRAAWDGSTLSTLTRNAPLRATDPHISLVGQISPDELRRHMTTAEVANGLMNRFLIVAVQRQHQLPFGGEPPAHEMAALARQLERRLVEARTAGLVRLTPAAREWYAAYYYERDRDATTGLLGELMARATSHIPRLALLYALLDGRREIAPEHLEAARAAWDYCAASTRWVFGAALGNPLADRLLEALRDANDWLSRSDLRRIAGGRVRGDEITAALRQLADAGAAEVETVHTGGRRVERWRAGSVERGEK